MRRPLLRRCYVCGRRYVPHRYGHPELHVTTRAGVLVEPVIHGHPDCLADLAASRLDTATEMETPT